MERDGYFNHYRLIVWPSQIAFWWQPSTKFGTWQFCCHFYFGILWWHHFFVALLCLQSNSPIVCLLLPHYSQLRRFLNAASIRPCWRGFAARVRYLGGRISGGAGNSNAGWLTRDDCRRGGCTTSAAWTASRIGSSGTRGTSSGSDWMVEPRDEGGKIATRRESVMGDGTTIAGNGTCGRLDNACAAMLLSLGVTTALEAYRRTVLGGISVVWPVLGFFTVGLGPVFTATSAPKVKPVPGSLVRIVAR